MGLKDDIPAATPAGRAAAIVKVREWNNRTVYVWAITSQEHRAFNRETARRPKDRVNIPERLLILCLRDENGVPHFTADDEDYLARQPVSVISKLFRICARHNGFADDDDDGIVTENP